MRIGIDARAASEVAAGKGRYVREVLRALARRDDPNTYVLYARERWEEPLDERFSWRLFELPDVVWHPRAAFDAGSRCDVFLATASYLTPCFLRIPTALVVHDLIAFRPEVHANRRAARIERATLPLAARRALRILCDSEATRADLVERFPFAGAKSAVVYPGVSELFFETSTTATESYGLGQQFILCAGTLEPRKNLARVLDAFAQVRPDSLLALVGPRGWDYDEILAQAHGLGDQVRVLGEVPDEGLAALYRLCTVFCFPSLYEGFGLPLLEAMAAGAACVTSNVSSLPEVGGDAVRYVEPTSVEAIAATLAELLESEPERRRLGELARERARSFSWKRTAAELVNHFVEVASSLS
jgi:glycosyltransferase involved in cell wall biosynthesis